MSKTVFISSADQFQRLLSSSRVVVTDFYADWCGPCKQIAPFYEQLSAQLSRPSKVTFTKVNVDTQPEVARKYGVTAMPTFMIFKNSSAVETIRGADPRKLQDAIKKLAVEADSDGSSSSGGFGDASSTWLGAGLPKGYKEVTDQVDMRGLDLLNADSGFGDLKTLLDGAKPSSISSGKGKSTEEGKERDWVESDTDEQLMLYMPFRATLKLHTLHITSLPPYSDSNDTPMRPKTVQLYTNRAHNLGFDEAEGIPPTQSITLGERDWDKETGTAKVELRFVKFQNITSLVVFVVDGNGDGEKVRLDRVRLIGETGEKREMGKLPKTTDEGD